jgi:hypothetical protein
MYEAGNWSRTPASNSGTGNKFMFSLYSWINKLEIKSAGLVLGFYCCGRANTLEFTMHLTQLLINYADC